MAAVRGHETPDTRHPSDAPILPNLGHLPNALRGKAEITGARKTHRPGLGDERPGLHDPLAAASAHHAPVYLRPCGKLDIDRVHVEEVLGWSRHQNLDALLPTRRDGTRVGGPKSIRAKRDPHGAVANPVPNSEYLLAVIVEHEIALAEGGGEEELEGIYGAAVVLRNEYEVLVRRGIHLESVQSQQGRPVADEEARTEMAVKTHHCVQQPRRPELRVHHDILLRPQEPLVSFLVGIHNTAMLTTRTERRVLRPLAFVALLLLLFTVLLSGGCSSDDDETVDAVAVLAESTTAMEALQSFHFTYNVTKPADAPPAEGFEVVRIVGDVTTEGNMQATIDMLQGGVPLQVAFVAAGATHYVQDPTTQKWQDVPAAFSPVGSLNLSAGTIQVLKRIVDPSYAATEDVGGSPAYHLTGEVAAADVAAIAGSTTSEKPFEGEVWVGVDDHLVKRIVIAGAATENEVDGTVRTIELSDFDKPVEIVPPQ